MTKEALIAAREALATTIPLLWAEDDDAPLEGARVALALIDDALAQPGQEPDLLFVQRVLESDAPKADREAAAQMVRDMRRAAPVAQPVNHGKILSEIKALYASESCPGTYFEQRVVSLVDLIRIVNDAAPVAQPEQEPVAWLDCFGEPWRLRKDAMQDEESNPTPLYASPVAHPHEAKLTITAPNGDTLVAHGTKLDMMTLDAMVKKAAQKGTDRNEPQLFGGKLDKAFNETL